MDHIVKMNNIVKQHKLTMKQLAGIFSRSQSTINNYLNGKTDIPLSFFIAFCDYFKVPYQSILSSHQQSQLLRISLDNSVRENKLLKEISELKDRLIDLQERFYDLEVKSKAS